MKVNKIEHNHRRRNLIALSALVLLAALGVGARIGYVRLRALYVEQCVIRDMSSQVEISSGKMVLPSTLAEEFGLRKGQNLADIDFAKRREEILAKIPNLRAIRISRRFPDKVSIVAEERVPVARMGVRGSRKASGRVVDSEGVVFLCQRGTQSLPLVLEPQAPGTAPGLRVKNRLQAALALVEECRSADFLELGLLEIDTSKRDFLVATLGNYSKVKICWEEMDERSARAKEDLESRLTLLKTSIRTRVSPETVIWNATLPGKIFADTQGKL